MKLRTKILSTYIGLTVVAIVLVGVLSSWQIKKYLEERIQRDLLAHVTLLVELFENGAIAIEPASLFDDRLEGIAHSLGVRVTILRHDGTVISVILFGSLARRRVTYDDIDVLIVTEPGPGSISEVTRQLAQEVFGPLFLQYGELFSFIVYTQPQLRQLEEIMPLLAEIRREGVLLYGRDPFTQTAGASVSANRSSATGDG